MKNESSNLIQSSSINNSTSNTFNGNTIKVNDELAEDGPGPAGLHRYEFHNGNNVLFSTLNIAFNTNADGSINGVPSIYYSGFTFFGWQTQQVSEISFNPYNLTSTLSVMGVITYVIQLGGGMTIGWTTNMIYHVTINTDENAFKPVVIYTQN